MSGRPVESQSSTSIGDSALCLGALRAKSHPGGTSRPGSPPGGGWKSRAGSLHLGEPFGGDGPARCRLAGNRHWTSHPYHFLSPSVVGTSSAAVVDFGQPVGGSRPFLGGVSRALSGGRA